MQTALKIGFRGEIHRIGVDLTSFGLPNLHAVFENTFGVLPGTYVVQYKDVDSNVVNVVTTEDFDTACCILLTMNESSSAKTLRFFAVLISKQTSIFDKVSTTVRQALDSIHNSKPSEQRSEDQTGATLTDTIHQTSASLGHTLQETLQKTVDGSKVVLDQAKKSWHDVELEHTLKQAAENIKVAAAGVSMYTQELVENIQKLHIAKPSTAPAPEPSPAPPITVPAPTPPAIQSEPTISPSEQAEPAQRTANETTKWAAELEIIHEIVPDADPTIVVALLETSKGDIQVVLDALTS
ncbi:unnamed protein product [Aphanomyces euteiches]|uniref:PB1 domain-containing protein n=1 Tax=Aphanomyces euteiches TaxID=100861 RepID=A0A6G0WSU3_9STRA|nr:hypothetical protein Ae201684_011935 [Aphanomyces euteiches]KAH9056163.1 hypothetical protein Ae201684P_021900 [Aphanomyces euteiches]KAH9139054.1 hypothetical protein AeRB84_016650 [Aphanomyces euteiches]